MKNRKMLILAVSLILVTMLFAFVTFRQQAQDATQAQDDVAVIQSGRQITEKEKAYDRAYGRSRHRRSKKLSQARISGDFDVYPDAFIDSATNRNDPALTRTQIFEKRVCDADAVIIGRAGSKTTHLNEDETLVYSEYDITVQEIIKNNASSPIQVNNIIQVTRPGGNIRFNERLIRFIVRRYTPLQNGKNYLLFLKYVPEANSYIPPDEGSDYLLDGNRATQAIRSSIKDKEVDSEDADSLLNLVRTSANTFSFPKVSG